MTRSIRLHLPDIGRWVLLAAMTALLIFSLLILGYVVNRAYFNDPSVKIRNLDGIALTKPVCPGQQMDVHTEIAVERPLLLFSYFSVMDEGLNHSVNGTQISNGARPHPHAASFTQTLTWTVPSTLEPGIYTRVLAFRGTDGRENSLFTWTKFEVSEDCDKP
jgi:hypothetical protein